MPESGGYWHLQVHAQSLQAEGGESESGKEAEAEWKAWVSEQGSVDTSLPAPPHEARLQTPGVKQESTEAECVSLHLNSKIYQFFIPTNMENSVNGHLM